MVMLYTQRAYSRTQKTEALKSRHNKHSNVVRESQVASSSRVSRSLQNLNSSAGLFCRIKNLSTFIQHVESGSDSGQVVLTCLR